MTLLLHWYDDNPKHPLAQRLAEGAARYAERFGQAPNVRQMSADEDGDGADKISTLTRNNYRFGYERPSLPGADWPTLPQYQSGHSCPARICVGGVVLEYVEGSLMDGRAEYREVTG